MPYRISRLGHVEIRSLDLDRDLDHYTNVLGLQLTGREGKTAYLKGWDERHAYSVCLTEADRAGIVRIDYGPGRHGITRGTTIYFFDPSGNRLETFGGYSAYQMDPDSRPVTWTQDQIAQAVFYYAQELNETFLSVYT